VLAFCFVEINLFPSICYAGFGVLAIPVEDPPLRPYEAMHLGDINEDISSHLAMAGNTIIAKIEIVAI
jgi:hypothetical protein